MISCYKNIICLLIILLLQACSGASVAPVANRGEVKETAPTTSQRGTARQSKAAPKAKPIIQNKPGYHIVGQGDTLYSIAWRYNYDYKSVASWNQINTPYTIYPGQLIRLKPVLKKNAATKKPSVIVKKTPSDAPSKPVTKPIPKKAIKEPNVVAQKNKLKTALPSGPIKWSWPTTGKLVSSNSPTSKKGIDISGKSGQLIKAAAAGDVVYSGSGLLGYGKLIIIKHNETYLSAYAYNSKLLVKEGDRVNAGQQISEMGQDHTGRNVLHFEIRKNGKPVTPSKHLPKKRV
ncbi:MAG: lipoprotein [marine bacterium B5-7]|nr:MAG: lipoprotein [marine bacterium B5-7]